MSQDQEVDQPDPFVLDEVAAQIEHEAERALYVVPESESVRALQACGFDAADATKPAMLVKAATNATKDGRAVVVVGQPDDAVIRYLAEVPGIDLREVALPPTSTSVWAMLGHVPSLRPWTQDDATVGRITWVTWAGGMGRAVGIATQPAVQVEADTFSRPFDTRLATECPGLIGQVVNWMLAASIRPQPALCLASAIATIGAVAGQRVATETDLRTNVYCLGIGETACGKDAGVSLPPTLLMRAGLHQFVGPGEWKSDSGLRAAIQAKPSHVAFLDEFTKKLAAMGSAHAPHLRAIREKMLEVFSKASGPWLAVAYADVQNRPPVEINCPNLCVYGTGVPSELFASLDRGALADGFLNRWLVFFADNQMPARQNPGRGGPPADLIAQLVEFDRKLGTKGSLVGANQNALPEARTVCWTDEARERMREIENQLDERVGQLREAKSPVTDLWVRVGAHMAKLALIRSVGIDPAKPIDLHDLAWSEQVVVWCVERMVLETESRVADSQHEAATKRVLREIVDAGPEGMSSSDMTRKTQWLTRAVRADILATLEESGQVVKSVVRSGQAGRPSLRWRAARFAGPKVDSFNSSDSFKSQSLKELAAPSQVAADT